MPIKIPDKLPATAQLRKENIFVMSEKKRLCTKIFVRLKL